MLTEKGKEVAQFIFTFNDPNSETVTEIKQWVVVDMATDRGCFIDQIQGLDIHFHQPDFQRLGSLHFYAWLKVW
ncbi:ribonucleotide-diphosphate reductase subunit rnr1 [Orobanche gracilis]